MAVRLSALRARRPSPPRKIPGTHFCQRLSRHQGHSASGRIKSIEKSNDIGNRPHDLPACSIVSQPTTLPRAALLLLLLLLLLFSNKHCPSARCAYAANAVGEDLDIFGIGAVSLNNIYTHQPKIC
jgi:hypothetical protein